MDTPHTPSEYQAAIYAAATSTRDNLVIEARAGCGKTSTILGTLRALADAKRIPASTILCAFNAAIRDELKDKAPDWCDVRTLHQVGRSALAAAGVRCELVADQYEHTRSLAIACCPDALRVEPGALAPQEHEARQRAAVRPYVAILKRLVGLSKNAGVGLEGATITGADCRAVAGEHDVEPPAGLIDLDGLCEWAAAILIATRSGVTLGIDFDDMIWLPGARGIPCRAYDLVCVDEAQDLNPAQLWLVRSMLRRRGRLIAVGDDRQAIYGWRGAGSGVLGAIAADFGCRVLPLPRTYRCAAGIVAEAQAIVPDYEGHRSEPGLVADRGLSDLLRDAAPGDYVLSRSNAPLAGICLALLRAGKPAAIAGKDVAAGLAHLIEGSGAESINGLLSYLSERTAAAERAAQNDPENEAKAATAERRRDEAETIGALAEGLATVKNLLGRIASLFVDPSGGSRPVILCSTTHKAKGLERDRVWLLRETYTRTRLRPLGDGRWEKIEPAQEEWNLLYVAVTRARDVLLYTSIPPKGGVR